MKRKNKPVLRVLALIMALVCLGVSIAPASFAFAGVLDPAAWLYPIWSMYGAQNGVNVTTTGDADFTIDGMTSLWNEYQASRVSSGLQQVAQTITEFVNGVKGFVSVVAGAVTGGSLNTKLMLGAGIVGALDAFWNWIITDKLGGSSVDSTDFDASTGNIAQSTGLKNKVPTVSGNTAAIIRTYGLYMGTPTSSQDVYVATLSSADILVYACSVRNRSIVFVSQSSSVASIYSTYAADATSVNLSSYDDTHSLYYWAGTNVNNYWGSSVLGDGITLVSSVADALSAANAAFGGSVVSGALSVVPDAGVDVLGFPDSDELNYVPSDAVIPWNIPYDSAKDTDAYIDAAFADAVSGDLTIGEEGEVIQPVPGVGPVGDYVAVGLGDVFPFCIPFDIYDFLSALAADPVAPSFTAELAFPEAVGGSQYVELDFDTPTFNQLASILRTMELLAFIVGLALLTRSMFIRG